MQRLLVALIPVSEGGNMPRSTQPKKSAPKPIGAMPTSKAVAFLGATGDPRARGLKARARSLKSDVTFEKFLGRGNGTVPVFAHTAHQYGFFTTGGADAPGTTQIADAAAMDPDQTLQNQ